MSVFDYQGSKQYYLDEGNGFPILFGHSFLCSSEIWESQVNLLKSRHRCIVPDLPSHGKSESTPSSIENLSDLSDLYASLMEHLNINEYYVVGSSIGGMWGLHLAMKHPNKVKALMTIGSDLGSEPEPSKKNYTDMANALTELNKFVPEIAEQLTSVFFAPKHSQEKSDMFQSFYQKLIDMDSETLQHIVKFSKLIVNRPDDLDKLSTISVPCLISVGESDLSRPPTESKRMAAEIPNADYIEIPDAGHLAALENPEYVNELIETFLNKHDTSQPLLATG